MTGVHGRSAFAGDEYLKAVYLIEADVNMRRDPFKVSPSWSSVRLEPLAVE